MAEFDYIAIDPAGRERKGAIKAETVEDARAKLDSRKLFIVRIEPGAVEKARRRAGLSFGAPRLSAKELTLFTRQLSTLIQVSPLEESLRTIGRQSEQAHVQAIVGKVHSGVLEGRRLADALGAEPRSFPPLYRAMISAGESSGSLPTIMERLSDLMERQAVIRSKVLTAIAYPSVLAAFAVCVVAALMIFVVPKVVEQFDTVGQQLPLLTRMVMGISAFLAGYWWLLAILLGVAGFGFWRALKVESFRYRFDAMLLRLPLLGRLIRDLHAARMARTLSTMVASRLPLMEGLSLTAQTVHNRVLRQASEEIVEAIRGGGSLSAALRRAGVFPPLLVYLAASGESAGRLDTMLERAADYLEREFDSFTSAALAMLEPVIIIAMGGIVAVIILSILLPILQLQSLTGA
ncbi:MULTISPECIES: type II secretion system inner membrane protein GspF [Sphingobium]|jgi:general secretion pathway protein F|uniref:General secretion pathway protein F n=1 Tax=Sphingobium fuliginis (strain ATCC 27551) TaxID=336203 RepID=A0A292ZJB4_SPHSA|nr:MULTISPECIES: type II secretion system inner membrane protein GspF [Sphingobium]AJR24883.1 general secretion pathway protein GspF [Sphingobium sp. YBL2]MCB4862154.1 type II secretion system inner membrane protein GspF [Sphingobium sp. PNB]PNQ01907.1 type II secretion system protein GspF [Sphingobium sp. SA916]QOT72043.1 type II secretion system inner membrane protein GspF [Sphingobium fuliginis]RYL95562.1 type II secretion system protein GspF [Sphingobium fuliginis]